MIDNNSIYLFDDPIEFVSKQLALKKERNSKFSLRAWSKQLGFSNPSMLSSVLKGERRLQVDLAEKIGKNLKLTISEQKYFKILVLQKNAKNDEERIVYSEMLVKARPNNDLHKLELDLDQFRFISDWYHYVLLEMINLKDFEFDYQLIAKRLGRGVSPDLVRTAIERLSRLGLVEESKLRKILKRTNGQLILDKNLPSDLIRNHHSVLIDFAKESISKQDISERDIRSTTISLKKEDFKAAQEILRKAHDEIRALSTVKSGDEVFEFTSQFFRITER